MGNVITIPYKPREWQKIIHNDNTRFKILVIHRRGGKTVLSINELIKQACLKTGRYAYIAPSYRMAKNIAWDMLKHYCPSQLIKGKSNESELLVRLVNDSIIQLFGSDNPDSLRGMGLDGVIFDEYAMQDPRIWGEIIRPTLMTTKGWATWIGTPNGRNHFYEVYQHGISDKEEWSNWKSYLMKWNDTNVLDIDEIEQAKKEMTVEQFMQEMECNFDMPVQGAVYGEEMRLLSESGRLLSMEYNPQLPTVSFWDFGIGDSTSVGIAQITPRAEEIRIIKHLEDNNKDIQYYYDWLMSFGYTFSAHYGDIAGKQRNLLTGKSIFEWFLSNGMHIIARKTTQIDEVHAVKKIFPRMLIDERLEKVIASLSNFRYIWDDKRGEWSREPYHDWSSHFCKALAYFAVNHFEPKQQESSIQQKINQLRKLERQQQYNKSYSL